MSTQTIKINQIHPGMIIEDDENVKVVVSDVWQDQGPGLGIMVKGRKISDASAYERRFLDTYETVERTLSGNPNDTMVSASELDETPVPVVEELTEPTDG